jgi:hypothetical protein
MGSAILNVGFLVAAFATVYFGVVFYAETVGATVDQLVTDEHPVHADHDDW